jgi:hypothetical protein
MRILPRGGASFEGTFWGRNNNPTYAIVVEGDGGVTYDTGNLIDYQSGTINDVLVGALSRPYASLPVFNLSHGSRIVER